MIQANDFKRFWHDAGGDVLGAVKRVGESGWYILGREVSGFEDSLAKAWGLRHAVGVGNGLDAIEICLRVLGCKPGDRVLTTPISAFATTLAIIRLGAVPVFVDCDDAGLVRLDLVERVLRENPDIHYFVPVHLYGFCLDLDQLERLREEFDLNIVEDCAQSILAAWGGRPTGSAGQMAATSFYPTKNLGAMGDGGAILTNDPRLASEAAFYRDYGQTAKYEHTRLGCNSRLDELHAAILSGAMLPRLAAWTERRRALAVLYSEAIDHPLIRVPRPSAHQSPCHHLFPVFVAEARKAGFLQYLREQGIATGEHYPKCIFEQEALSRVPFGVVGNCDNALKLCRGEVSLPLHPYLSDEEAAEVIRVCNAWCGK